MDFEKFSSLTRFSQGWTVTEKIDGTNGQIAIDDDGTMYVGSRNRWLTPSSDNMGFCKWAINNKEELLKLGPGRHFGEWWGNGIQRGYGLSEKRFSLFNVLRWEGNPDLPTCCHVVPCFIRDEYLDATDSKFAEIMEELLQGGSKAAEGFDNPEGIVLYHRKSGVSFKKTFDYDEKGKWAQQLEAKSAQ